MDDYGHLADLDALADRLLAEPAAIPAQVERLADADAEALVARIKAEAERCLWVNARRSLELGDLIVRIGDMRGNSWQRALGMMQRGDALRALGQIGGAWEVFAGAGALFQQAGDEVGWARTRIGRLLCAVELNTVAAALADAELARAIFARRDQPDRLLALSHSMAIVYDQIGDHQSALALCHAAISLAESLGERGRRNLGPLYSDTGCAYRLLGDFRRAADYYERSRAICAERRETRALALVELNMADIAMSQGQYRRALQLLHHARDLYLEEQLPLDATHAARAMVECYLLLNRYAEARDLAAQTISAYAEFGATYKQGLTLLDLATAEAELGDLDAACAALDHAEQIFSALNAPTWLATARLRRGQIALSAGDPAARALADHAIAGFQAGGRQVEQASATLLRGQVSFAGHAYTSAAEDGAAALDVARGCAIPALRYSAHLLLGRIAEAQGQVARAVRRYTAATATIDRVQRGLTITLRPGFLEDKGEALRGLLRLHLRAGRAACAFEALERAKSQTLLGYLANREQLRWAGADERSRALIDELERLREEHQWFHRLAHDQPAESDQRPAVSAEQALAELAERERRMRAVTERLYLYADCDRAAAVAAPRLGDIQRSLDDETLLVEFYNDGAELWAFTLDRRSLAVHQLPITVKELDRLLAQLQANIDFALKAGPAAPSAQGLTTVALRILQRLHAVLWAPLAERVAGRSRLVVVPYGALHYLPFHLLHDGAAYLVERHEIAVLPAAGLALRRAPRQPGGARILAHSWNGRLAQTGAEARIVQRLFGGEVYAEGAARRAALVAAPTQILHIAAHGEHRLDQPDLSYIQLADGQLYTDDLLQHDLSYELVTLSACETGRANVAAGDELIGLGRGFLYAGAGALITSLWRVADDATVEFMERVYSGLRAGSSKAAALRNAQRAVLVEAPRLHPAFWGAFQLVGDAAPLSHGLS